MSRENVEVVRRMYEAFHGRDVEGTLSHFDPDVLVDAVNARPDAPVGKGREYLNAILTGWIASWEEWHEEIEEMRDLGNRVLVLIVHRGRGMGSGVELEVRYAILYEVHGGKVTSVRMCRNLEEALEAAGLRE